MSRGGPENSSHFDNNEMKKALADGFIELIEGLREFEWIEVAVDEAKMMLEPKLDEAGKKIGLRLVPKPPSTPQDLVDRV